MARIPVGLALRERLGERGTGDLIDTLNEHGDAWKADAMTRCMDRFDTRLQTLVTHAEFARGVADLRSDIAQQLAHQRVELLRWSFLFWIGQVAALAGLLGLGLHLIG